LATRKTKYLIIQCLITGTVELTGPELLLTWFYDKTFIYERVVRLFFDLLHGIKRLDVPLIMLLEFMVFLGYDGKLDANSDMENELFCSALEQLKERFIVLY